MRVYLPILGHECDGLGLVSLGDDCFPNLLKVATLGFKDGVGRVGALRCLRRSHPRVNMVDLGDMISFHPFSIIYIYKAATKYLHEE